MFKKKKFALAGEKIFLVTRISGSKNIFIFNLIKNLKLTLVCSMMIAWVTKPVNMPFFNIQGNRNKYEISTF